MASPNSKIIDPNIIKAQPTKEFFISMLVKDITLKDAIGDLVDNSIDGANRHMSTGGLDKFFVKIKVTNNKFEIKDNCGGIDIVTARNYAFRFGRPNEYKIEKNSIGQFGIGMKRAFFKIGRKIKVNSTAINSKFTLNIDVNKWQILDDWDFKLENYEDKSKIKNKVLGTNIEIDDLSEDARSSFDNKFFIKTLIDEIAYEHLYSLNKGLRIEINDIPIKPPKLKIIYDKEFKPAYWKHKFEDKLSVEVITGIGEDLKDEGGWYIFCNDRLIIGPDTTPITGWTGRREGADGVAVYHDQFYRFRGYVFFNSPDPSKLPWTTTKTSMDQDSPKYKFVRKKMIQMMKPAMTLMNSLKKEREKDKPLKERILNQKVMDAKLELLNKILENKEKLDEIFHYPKEKVKVERKNESKIAYSKPISQIEELKKIFKVSTNADVGEKTFNYCYKRIVGD